MPPTDSRSVLVVDADDVFRAGLVGALGQRGLEARGAADYDGALVLAREESPELALVDLRLPGGRSGLELVRDLKALDETTAIVILTGHGSIATAVEGLKLGAMSYLTKPVDADQILAAFDHSASADRSLPSPKLQPLAPIEWEHIHRVLADCDGNLSQAARLLGIHRRSLQRKLSKNPTPGS